LGAALGESIGRIHWALRTDFGEGACRTGHSHVARLFGVCCIRGTCLGHGESGFVTKAGSIDLDERPQQKRDAAEVTTSSLEDFYFHQVLRNLQRL
jgi:hypothetical protein